MTTPESLQITCLTSPKELDSVREEWDAFVLSSGSDIYFTVDWLLAWWEFYSEGRTMCCFMIHEGVRVVAALPFFTQKLWAGPIRIRHAGFIGADSTISVFNPPVEVNRETEVLVVTLKHLMDRLGCEVVSFSPLSGCSTLPAVINKINKTHEQFHVVETGRSTTHIIFDLPQTFEDHVSAFGKQTRRDFRRSLKRLKEECEISTIELSGIEARVRFDDFIKMHNIQWEKFGNLGHFGDWPDSIAFNHRLIERMDGRGLAHLLVLLTKTGQVLALQYYFLLGQNCYARLVARILDEKVNHLGIGRVMFLKFLEHLITEGVDFVEAGPGHYPYKINLGGKELPLRRLVICRPTAMAIVKLKLLTGWADLLNLFYYRIWFLKLAPKLGLTKKPLWKSWIRTRF